MFRQKKKGLRSLRNTVILLTIILLFPLIILFLAKVYFTAPPIFPEYQEWVSKANTKDNGYFYFSVADKIAKRIFCGFFSSMLWNVQMPDSPDTYRYTKNEYKVEKWDAYTYLYFYDFLIKENLFTPEVESYAKGKYPISQLQGVFMERICIFPRGNWVRDILSSSREVLNDIQTATHPDFSFFLTYDNIDSQGGETIPFSTEMRLIELVNILLYLQKGDYKEAIEWIKSFNKVCMIPDTFWMKPMFQFLVLEMVSKSSLAEPILDDLICYMMELKDSFRSMEVKTIYRYELFNLEDTFNESQKRYLQSPPQIGIPKVISLFFAYNHISRSLDKNRDAFENATWEDLENAIVHKKGKLYEAINAIQSENREMRRIEMDVSIYRDFRTGEVFQKILRNYNYVLCHAYRALFTTILKKYYIEHGVYPDSIDKILTTYFSEDEHEWFKKHVDFYLSPDYYYIVLRAESDSTSRLKNAYTIWTY